MLKPGDVVGPYEIRGFLGQGGMGQVFKAFDPRLERTVALKVIVLPDAKEEGAERISITELEARLLREARAVASLSHPNVVGIYDVGESQGRLYLAMEFVVGATLRSFLIPERIPLGRKLRWLVDVARALEVAHRAGLVHRDVKPENVMIREDGVVKVLDFGIARRTMRTEDAAGTLDTVTGGGTVTGTPVYMSPEQLKGNSVDARSDQFAWGVMAYELITGHRPWDETGDVFALVARVLTEPAPPLRNDGPDVPQPVEDSILRSLSKEPAARFESMAVLADILEPFATSSTGSVSASQQVDPRAFAATTRVPTSTSITQAKIDDKPGPKSSPARSRGQWAQLAVPIALLIALLAIVLVIKRRSPVSPAPTPRPLSLVPEAEIAYKEALQLWRDGATAKAFGSFRSAIELDATFAAAHLELAVLEAEDDPAFAQASFQKAFEYRHLLLPRDVALLEASEPYIRPLPDLDEWETRLTSVVFQFPRDAELQFLLGRARERRGTDDLAKTSYEAAIRLDAGFVPALAALASTEQNLGLHAEAMATIDRCIRQSPIATTCFETRYRLLSDGGDCHAAREQAAQWRTVAPSSASAFRALGHALYADGAPRPSVEEALEHARALLPEAQRAQSERWDRMLLAIALGDLAKADELAVAFRAELPKTKDRYEQSQPWRISVDVQYESGQIEQAAKTARGFLERMDAWPAHPFSMDPSLWFYGPIYRAGHITKAEFERQQAAWLQRETQRLANSGDRSPRAAWELWSVYGGFAETKEEAVAAIRVMPNQPLPESYRSVAIDYAKGKTYALVGEPQRAIGSLTRVTSTCSSLNDALTVLRARYYLGVAYEANHQIEEARDSYTRALATWPLGTPSRTERSVAERLRALK